jgi:hypothetical protein
MFSHGQRPERKIEGLREQLSVIHECSRSSGTHDEDACQDVGEMLPLK